MFLHDDIQASNTVFCHVAYNFDLSQVPFGFSHVNFDYLNKKPFQCFSFKKLHFLLL